MAFSWLSWKCSCLLSLVQLSADRLELYRLLIILWCCLCVTVRCTADPESRIGDAARPLTANSEYLSWLMWSGPNLYHMPVHDLLALQ